MIDDCIINDNIIFDYEILAIIVPFSMICHMGNNKMILIGGPCVIESQECLETVASTMKDICNELDIDYYFKASFDKANRTSITSYRGPGIVDGLKMLSQIKERCNIPIATDIHEPWQSQPASEVADILQIPAFLCRQTDLLIAAGKTGKIINVKKAQFLAPWDMKNVADKIASTGNHKMWVPMNL